jgi:hypothetical protein
LFILPVIVGITACSKGKDGPQGPQGPQGAQGPQGPQGPIGAANVTYSAWFRPTNYTTAMIFGIRNFTHDEAAPAITQEILDKGVVITFGKLLGYNASIWPANQVATLPITITYIQGATQEDTWSARASVGTLQIRFTNSANIYTSIATAHEFRYVIIPGGQGLGSMDPRLIMIREQITNGQAVDYRTLCDLINIPE